MRLAFWVAAAGLWWGAGTLAAGGGGSDLDADGLPDKLEQTLLDRFVPEFVLAGDECDGLPAELTPDVAHPLVRARNGVVYGQAFARRGGFVELHYFHLWGRDCGRAGHALDAEHVSVLLEQAAGKTGKQWRARYWYAAGHEGTVCDRSTGARAEFLHAVEQGARVWVSAGKHASYLDAGNCKWGCGADRCLAGGRVLKPKRVVNVGELGRPSWGVVDIVSAVEFAREDGQ